MPATSDLNFCNGKYIFALRMYQATKIKKKSGAGNCEIYPFLRHIYLARILFSSSNQSLRDISHQQRRKALPIFLKRVSQKMKLHVIDAVIDHSTVIVDVSMITLKYVPTININIQ